MPALQRAVGSSDPEPDPLPALWEQGVIANKAEAGFAASLTARGLEYEHQPRGFRLYYRPDFYVPH